MIYLFKDGSGYQQFPEPAPGSSPYLEVTGTTEQRILNGDRYRLVSNGEVIEFSTQAEIDAEDAAAALAAERASLVVSRFQARAALLQNNLLDTAAGAIAQADAMSQLAWEDAQEFRRNSPLVASIGGALGLTDEQLDDLFRLAKTIEA
jgi:hypothetical protein